MQSRRKFFLVLPLLTLPFLTFAFWALGGGSGSDNVSQKNPGLNLQLPGANLKDDSAVDKLGYYDKAQSDSERIKDLMKNDPYYKSAASDKDTMADHSMEKMLPESNYKSTVRNTRKSYADPNEEKVYRKLEQLNNIIKTNDKATSGETNPVNEKLKSTHNDETDRLEQIMKTITSPDNGDDPEMKQLNGTLDKILEIQHPERINEKIKETSVKNKGHVFPVTVTEDESISLLETIPSGKGILNAAEPDSIKRDSTEKRMPVVAQADNGFFSFNDEAETETHNSVEAVIHETQTLVSGAPVKLRLLDDVYINGTLIPKDNFVFGTASLNGERLKITVAGIRYQNSLLPVALSVYDIDGMEGIYIPGALSRDVAKQSADNALQNIAVNSIDPSIGAQALGVGIEAGKNLLSKKAKLIRVTVKAGYKVLLKDNNNK